MTPDELDAIEARAAAATPGPWAAEDERHGKGSCSCCGEVLYAWNIVAPSREVVVSAMDDVTPGVHGDADATFIAHARTDVPALITALREAWAEAEAMLRGEVDGMFTSVVHGCCAEVEQLKEALDEAIRHKVELDDLRRQAKAERDEARAAIAHVRALCDEAERWALSSPSVSTSRIRAVLDGKDAR